LLENGLIWRIGDGATAGIWHDRWIPLPSTFKIQSQPKSIQINAKVKELIDVDTKWWNMQRLKENFSSEEVRAITSIPLSGVGHSDVKVWRGTDSGLFTVRSAYHLANEIERTSEPECSRRRDVSDLWKIIWQLQMPNADKNFMWRACHNILPTRDNLLKRRIIKDPWCPICGIEVETATHILWACPSAVDVWSSRERMFQKCDYTGMDFLPLVEEIYEKGGKEMLVVFIRQAKNIWMRRNAVVHGENFVDPNVLVRMTSQALIDFKKANEQPYSQERQVQHPDKSLWTKPHVGSFKVNWDVGVDRENDKFGLGIVIRDAVP
jgi:hypothetical protein